LSLREFQGLKINSFFSSLLPFSPANTFAGNTGKRKTVMFQLSFLYTLICEICAISGQKKKSRQEYRLRFIHQIALLKKHFRLGVVSSPAKITPTIGW